MARIAIIEKKEDLQPEHQPTYDAIAQSRGVVGGPFLALLHSPELAGRTAHLGSYVRFESSLEPKVIELVALVSARELQCKHEWAAHVNHAQKAGIPLDTIRAVHQCRDAKDFTFEDAQIVSGVRELLRAHRITETTFQALYARFGERGLVELTATVGYYAMLACTLNAFDIATASAPEEFRI
jgi:4-carboxymuconolactone decarboxylase